VTRGESARVTLALAALVLVGIPGAAWWIVRHEHAAPSSATPRALYQCPMHPTMTSERPGDCPICGMRLVLVAASH